MSESLSPGEGADFFALFGLPRGYQLDRDLLERTYLERSREAHPDRFVGAAVGEQRRAVEAASALNQAYRTLRDPVRRAEYLVKLGGIDLDRSDRDGGAPDPGQAFLIEMVELRESLEEARGRDEAAVSALRGAIEARAEAALDAAIDALEAARAEAIAAAADHLVIYRYLQRFLEEVDGDHEPG